MRYFSRRYRIYPNYSRYRRVTLCSLKLRCLKLSNGICIYPHWYPCTSSLRIFGVSLRARRTIWSEIIIPNVCRHEEWCIDLFFHLHSEHVWLPNVSSCCRKVLTREILKKYTQTKWRIVHFTATIKTRATLIPHVSMTIDGLAPVLVNYCHKKKIQKKMIIFIMFGIH